MVGIARVEGLLHVVDPQKLAAAAQEEWMVETDDGSGPSFYCLGELVSDVFDAMFQRSPYWFMKVSNSRPICCASDRPASLTQRA